MALYIWDITLKYSRDFTERDIITDLKPLCKKYGFQQEIGDGGYHHYQMRVSLIKKTTQNNLIKLFKNTCLKGCHISPTSNGCNDIYHYVNKEATRVKGSKPYTDKSPEPPQLTSQLKYFIELTDKEGLYPWQNELAKMSQLSDFRKITFIYDPNGHNGKSLWIEWMEWCGYADEIPMMNSFEDISGYVCSRVDQGFQTKCYLIDMPRGLRKEKLAQFYTGMECIKDGKAFDKRYRAGKKRFDRPQIFVFTNTLPTETQCLSKDRWQIKLLNQTTKSLEDITHTLYPTYETTPNEYDLDSD